MNDIRVCLFPAPEQVEPETGIGRVILAQAKHLPGLGFQITNDPHRADIIACHVSRPDNYPRVDVCHIHGGYFRDIPHESYQGWHNSVNRVLIQSAKEAIAVTVPSEWVAMPFRRDMRINPTVIGHGVDPEEWKPGGKNLHYVFWGKNRNQDACLPDPAYELARRGVEVISTFAPRAVLERDIPKNMTITGLLPASQMRAAVGCAEAYLATTMETFGIGTLEALACGIPVLGYDWGGTRDIVRHGVEGFLVEPGDYEGLLAGLEFIRAHRDELSANAILRAREFTWERAAEKYAALYRQVLGIRESEGTGVSVVVPNHNYSAYLPDCIRSLQSQTIPPQEIIIVDDCSTDNSRAVIGQLAAGDSRISVIQHARNLGVAASRNDGIAKAKGPFLICLDADDQLAPDYIAICSQALAGDRSLGIVYTGLSVLYENGQRGATSWPPEFDWEIMTAVSVPPSNCIPSAAMFRKSMWERAGGYRQIHAPAEDTEFWVRGLSVGFNARKVSGAELFIYRAHAGSASRTKEYHAIDAGHPWMRDKQYPMGAPNVRKPIVNSYALPLVSVIIPVGPHHGQYLPAALDSLLAQTFRGWEAIVIDDTGQVGALDRVLGPYPFVQRRVSFEREPGYLTEWKPLDGSEFQPQGAGAARNVGLAHARGPLCLFLDADDFLEPTALEKMVQKFSESGGRYVYTDWVSFDAEGTHAFHELDDYAALDWVSRLVTGAGGLNAVTVLVATADARRIAFDESLPGFEDSDFFARCAVSGVHGVRLPEPLLYYRVYSGTRRLEAQKEKDSLAKIFRKRYGPYLKGEKPMASCCGGSAGDAVLAAKRYLNMQAPEPVSAAPAAGSGRVKMEFTGSETGPIPYKGAKGDVYRGANSPLHRFIMAHPDDVEMLARTGKWRVVPQPVTETPQTSPLPAPAPQKSVEELRKEAEAALLSAKGQGVDELAELGLAMRGVPGPLPEEEPAAQPAPVSEATPEAAAEPAPAKRSRAKKAKA